MPDADWAVDVFHLNSTPGHTSCSSDEYIDGSGRGVGALSPRAVHFFGLSENQPPLLDQFPGLTADFSRVCRDAAGVLAGTVPLLAQFRDTGVWLRLTCVVWWHMCEGVNRQLHTSHENPDINIRVCVVNLGKGFAA